MKGNALPGEVKSHPQQKKKHHKKVRRTEKMFRDKFFMPEFK